MFFLEAIIGTLHPLIFDDSCIAEAQVAVPEP